MNAEICPLTPQERGPHPANAGGHQTPTVQQFTRHKDSLKGPWRLVREPHTDKPNMLPN